MKKTIALLVSAVLTCQALAYQVTLPIQHRSKGSLQTGIRQGAAQVILRLTAQQSAVNTLADEIKKAQYWVDQYSTTHRPDDADYPWLLDVSYSKRRIQQLLDQYHLPYWKQAPAPISVLLKTAADLTIGEKDPRWTALQQAAAARGYHLQHLKQAPTTLTQNGAALEFLMVTLPDTDVEPKTEMEAQTPTPPELSSEVTDSRAYHIESNGIHWAWYHQGEWQQWQQEPNEQWAEQAAEVIGAQLVHTQPKQTTNNLTPIHISIDGVSSFSDYTQAIQTLKQLHNVQSMIDDGIRNDQLSVTMIADVPVFDIKQSLDDVQQLTPLTDTNQADSEADLRYYWGVPPSAPPAPANQKAVAPTATVATEATVDEQAFPYDNAAKDDAQGPTESLPPQD